MRKDPQDQNGVASERMKIKRRVSKRRSRWINTPDDGKASVGGASRLDFNVLDENDEVEMVAGTLEPSTVVMNTIRNVRESSSPGKIEKMTEKPMTEFVRRTNRLNAAREPFLETLPEEE